MKGNCLLIVCLLIANSIFVVLPTMSQNVSTQEGYVKTLGRLDKKRESFERRFCKG